MKKKILLVLILLVIGAWFLTSEKREEQHVIADIEQTSELTQSIAITQSRYESKHLDIHEEMPSEIGFELLEEPNVNAVIVNLSDEQIVKRAKEIVKEARLPEEVSGSFFWQPEQPIRIINGQIHIFMASSFYQEE